MSKKLMYKAVLPLELKEVISEDNDGIVTIKGHAAAFNNIDKWNDVILPGAFKKWISIGSTSVPILLNHNNSLETTAGYNVSAQEDEHGLAITGQLNTKTNAGMTAYQNIQHAQKLGKQIGLSIGYYAIDKEYREVDGKDVRYLKEVDVVEYSLTNSPANINAKITDLKTIIEEGNTEEIAERKRFIERVLRDAGCSRKTAEIAVATIFNKSDSADEEIVEDVEIIEDPQVDEESAEEAKKIEEEKEFEDLLEAFRQDIKNL